MWSSDLGSAGSARRGGSAASAGRSARGSSRGGGGGGDAAEAAEDGAASEGPLRVTFHGLELSFSQRGVKLDVQPDGDDTLAQYRTRTTQGHTQSHTRTRTQ